MAQQVLFDAGDADGVPPGVPEADAVPRAGAKRMRMAVRNQIEILDCCLDDLVPDDHQVRVIWEFVCRMDLTELVARIQAVEGGPGQSPADPRILMALWLYATVRGVGSARLLNQLCVKHIDFRWLCGGVSMNYHTLSDFRNDHVVLLDRLLTDSVAVLMHAGLISLERVAQDGVKVRASAGAGSFRRGRTLQECRREAEEHLRELRQQEDEDPGATKARVKAARMRAAQERAERVEESLKQLPDVEAAKKPKDREKARVSTTDPDARVMKMADGGYRPAYNVQFATETQCQIITGVNVTNSGGDQGQLLPMVEQHENRYGKRPGEALADGGFVKKEDIETLAQPSPTAPAGTKVYAPVMPSKTSDRDQYTPRADDSPAVAEWRQRMGTEAAKEIYKQRAATAELTNAHARNRGLQRFLVRGLDKVKAVALWYALAHNLLRTAALRAAGCGSTNPC